MTDKLTKAAFVVYKMTENVATFPTPDPSLEDLGNAMSELAEAEINASQGGKDRTLIRDQKLAALEELMDREVLYVQTVTLGDPDLVALAGMDVKEDPTPWPAPQKPLNFRAEPGKYEGSVYLACDAVKYKREYVFQVYTEHDDGTGQWTDIVSSGRYSITHQGLERGKVYRFRVYASNAAGQSPYSDEANCPAR